MKAFATQFRAVCAKTGDLVTYQGPIIFCSDWNKAQKWCDENAGYLTVTGIMVAEIPTKKGTRGHKFDLDIENITEFGFCKN